MKVKSIFAFNSVVYADNEKSGNTRRGKSEQRERNRVSSFMIKLNSGNDLLWQRVEIDYFSATTGAAVSVSSLSTD